MFVNSPDNLLRRRLKQAHLLLLRACLWENEKGLAAWQQWRGENDIETADAACSRLFPLLYRRLSAFAADDPAIIRLKGAHRYTWVNNISRLKHAEKLVLALRAANIEPVFLKGIPLLLETYSDVSARFINDIDFLVPDYQVEEAITVLDEQGHTPLEENYRLSVQFDYALPFISTDGIVVDLHWHALSIAREPEIDSWLGGSTVELQLGEQRVSAFSATAQLVVACVQMMLDSVERQVRYMADAYKLIRAENNSVDWEQLVDCSLGCGLAQLVAAPLRLLKAELELDLPDNVLRRLGTQPRTLLNRIESRVQLAAPSAPVRLARRWCLYQRAIAEQNEASGFLDYLSAFYETPTRSALLWDLARRTLK